MPHFQNLTEKDQTCPECELGPVGVLEVTGRGVEFRSDLFDVCEDSEATEGIARYYLHFNQRP